MQPSRAELRGPRSPGQERGCMMRLCLVRCSLRQQQAGRSRNAKRPHPGPSFSSFEADAADRVQFIRLGCGRSCACVTWLPVTSANFLVTLVLLLPSKDFWYSVVHRIIF
ncbi:hypothetical protein J1605_005806 [Eschrichtius robustus]|uniref:Uncharacterized protein n=1 Tax=Eschrichtius robustus TaxID=9764 RepID=A0AB34H8J1_ESCRO|nr:hypothetical protein J1605_005806 [Eschrichtius robustus]